MPKRLARPRARPRGLEGLDRLNAATVVAVGPDYWPEREREAECRRFVFYWSELRDEEIAKGPEPEDWAYRVLELGEEPPVSDFPQMLGLEGDELETFAATLKQEQAELAVIVRRLWKELHD